MREVEKLCDRIGILHKESLSNAVQSGSLR